MTKKEQISKVLEELGYKPQVDDDGDLMVRYQMKSIYAIVGDDDEHYVVMTIPQFFDIEEGEEPVALAVCNKLTRELKLAKVYVDHTFKKVSANCEFYYTDEGALKDNVEKSLKLLGVVRTMYKNARLEILG